ncbi:MAG: four helix bundle protein [Betaproteobacteria bacterium]|nr:four helix bundle protein [Betaproteobacteria bacterium]
MQGFRSLHVWHKAHEFVLSAYRVTAVFPREEQFALTTQIRRAATSIPANVAEGCGRGSDADFARFLQMAIGSANEVEYHLLLARDLNFISRSEHQSLSRQLIEVRRMLISLTQTLRTASFEPRATSYSKPLARS